VIPVTATFQKGDTGSVEIVETDRSGKAVGSNTSSEDYAASQFEQYQGMRLIVATLHTADFFVPENIPESDGSVL
jgi:hypothetical protein